MPLPELMLSSPTSLIAILSHTTLALRGFPDRRSHASRAAFGWALSFAHTHSLRRRCVFPRLLLRSDTCAGYASRPPLRLAFAGRLHFWRTPISRRLGFGSSLVGPRLAGSMGGWSERSMRLAVRQLALLLFFDFFVGASEVFSVVICFAVSALWHALPPGPPFRPGSAYFDTLLAHAPCPPLPRLPSPTQASHPHPSPMILAFVDVRPPTVHLGLFLGIFAPPLLNPFNPVKARFVRFHPSVPRYAGTACFLLPFLPASCFGDFLLPRALHLPHVNGASHL